MDTDTLAIQALRDCLVQCQQVENLDPSFCQDRCRALTPGAGACANWQECADVGIQTFLSGVGQDVRSLGTSVGGFVSRDLRGLLILVAVILGLYLAIQVV